MLNMIRHTFRHTLTPGAEYQMIQMAPFGDLLDVWLDVPRDKIESAALINQSNRIVARYRGDELDEQQEGKALIWSRFRVARRSERCDLMGALFLATVVVPVYLQVRFCDWPGDAIWVRQDVLDPPYTVIVTTGGMRPRRASEW